MADKPLTRTELVEAIASKTGQSKKAVNETVEALFETVAASVSKGQKVTIPGWFQADRTSRAARQGRNPQTGETIQIPASNGVKLSAGSKLKAAVK